jgi:anthranilate synthase/aminodeoxychorismate synthase-like glutamine amidotransferase
MMLVIDNFDSFTYNLVQYYGELGVEQTIRRNDQVSIDAIRTLKPDRILISPGPCNPDQAGSCLEIIEAFKEELPILGICLGHQCICQHFGGSIVRANRIMHGKLSPISHNGEGLFRDIPQDFCSTRYHSLLLDKDTTPDCVEVTATTDQGEIMGIRHKSLPIHGVQFHPESIASEHGMRLLANFLDI